MVGFFLFLFVEKEGVGGGWSCYGLNDGSSSSCLTMSISIVYIDSVAF